LHAEEEMDDDNLSIFDIEHIVLSGKIDALVKSPILAIFSNVTC